MAAILGGLWAIYARTAGFDYVRMDDYEYVVLSEPVTRGLTADGVLWAFTTMRMSNWHPLTWLSYMADVSLFGLLPGPQHLVNVALHGANSLLLYAIAHRILRNAGIAFLVAFLFMAHALRVESVAWIAERKDVLCGLFFLAAMWLHLRYAASPSPLRYASVVLAGALALMSKPMAVTLPLALLLLDFWPLRRLPLPGWRRWVQSPAVRGVIVEKIPLFVLSLGTGILTLLAQGNAMAGLVEVPLGYRFANATEAYATYLRQMVLPTGLAAIYRLDAIDWLRGFLPAFATVASLSVLAYRLRAARPWFAFGWVWFLVTLLPVIGLLQVGSQSHADRYMYLPSVGLLLAAGAGLLELGDAWIRRWRAALAALLVFHAAMAWIQVGYWRDQYMMYSRILDVDPHAYQGHLGLSAYFMRQQLFEQSALHAEQAMRLQPDSPVVYANLGNLNLQRSAFPEAERMFRKALALQPGHASAMNNLGIALEGQGRLAEAREAFRRALALDPDLRGVAANLRRVEG